MRQLFTLLFCLISFSALAQKQNVYFLKNNGLEVKIKDSADFIRIIQEPDSTNSFFKVLEFYPDNSRKFIGHVSSFEPKLVYEGATMLFYKNGKNAASISYVLGIPFGPAYFFYPNGHVKKELNYPSEGPVYLKENQQLDNAKVTAYFDTTGKQVVVDGQGFAVITNENDMLREEGNYSGGLKDSIWKGYYKEPVRFYEEVYKNGELISGIQTFPDGRKFSYSKIKEIPQYSGGEKQFFRFLQTNFIYPKEARDKGISGKLSIRFNVNLDGTVSDIKSIPTLDLSIDREVTRVIKRTGKWIPGKIRGEPINSQREVGFGMNIGPPTIIRQETQQIPNGTQSPRTRKSF